MIVIHIKYPMSKAKYQKYQDNDSDFEDVDSDADSTSTISISVQVQNAIKELPDLPTKLQAIAINTYMEQKR